MFGFYEKRLCVLLFISSIPDAFESLQVLTLHFKPGFVCSDVALSQVGKQQNTGEQNSTFNTTSAQCFYNLNQSGFDRFTRDEPTNIQSTKCRNFLFIGREKSVVSEFSLVCSDAWKDPLLVSIYMIGKIFGHFFGGVLSDRLGRRPTFLIFLCWQFSSTLLLSLVNSVELYAFVLLLTGCGSSVSYAAAVFLGTETVEPKRRSLMYFVVGLGFATGFMVVPAVGFWLRDWRWFLRFYGSVGLLFIPYIWLVDETPKWLAAKGKSKDLGKLLKKVAKTNGVKYNQEEVDILINAENEKVNEISTLKTFWSLVKHRSLIFRLFAVWFAWWCCSVSYFAITFNIPNLSGNRFLNLFYGGVAEAVSVVSYFFFAEYWGRRWTYCGLMAFNAVSLGAMPLVNIWSSSLVVVLAVTSKLAAGTCFAIIYIYTGELFPTNVRHTLFGICNVCSKIGAAVAPFIVYAGESGYTVGPFVGMAFTMLFSSFLCFFLPETKNTELPQSVEAAVSMKRHMFSKHCKRKQNAAENEI